MTLLNLFCYLSLVRYIDLSILIITILLKFVIIYFNIIIPYIPKILIK